MDPKKEANVYCIALRPKVSTLTEKEVGLCSWYQYCYHDVAWRPGLMTQSQSLLNNNTMEHWSKANKHVSLKMSIWRF